jgi:hypothetical protein
MGVNIWVNRKHIYLDIYHKGQRHRELLAGLRLIGDKATDRETMRLANIARARRAQQVFAEEWDLLDPVAGKQTLYGYIGRLRGCHGNRRRRRRLPRYGGNRPNNRSEQHRDFQWHGNNTGWYEQHGSWWWFLPEWWNHQNFKRHS